jgi:hypothetical protein
VNNSRITRRNDLSESSHRILLTVEKEAALIYSLIVNFISYVVDPLEFCSVEKVQNNEN